MIQSNYWLIWRVSKASETLSYLFNRESRYIYYIYTRKWFLLQGELAPLTMLYFLINNKPKLIRSMLAAGIVQDTFSGEAGEGDRCRD